MTVATPFVDLRPPADMAYAWETCRKSTGAGRQILRFDMAHGVECYLSKAF